MIKYPITCITNGSKMSWLLKAQELLRCEQNIMRAWQDAGIPEIVYQKLRAQVQIDFPYYAGKLNKTDWERYYNDRFLKKSSLIGQGIGQIREQIFASTTYSPNLDDDITDA